MSLPVRGGIAPTQRKKPVNFFLPKFLGAVTYRGEIGDEAEVPEQERDRKISADRKDVPHEWAAELRPHSHCVRIWNQPVKNPWTTEMQQRHRSRAGDGEQRHGLGETVDRRAPLLKKQKQNRGDECAGVRNSHPPNEVHNRESPGDRDVDAPDAYAPGENPGYREQKHHQQKKGDEETDGPAHWRTSQRNFGDGFVD